MTVLVAAVAFVVLIGVGVTFGFALGIPIVAQVIEFLGGSARPDVAAIAVRVARFWWAFAALSGVSFCAAVLVFVAAVRALRRLDVD